MKIHLLGTTGYHPTNTRQTACLFLPEVGVVLDAGSGMFRVRDLIATETLDIFITHAHLDHVLGLTFLLDVLWQKPVQAVRVWGEAHKLAEIQTHLFSEALFPVLPPIDWRPLATPTIPLPAGGTLRWFPLVHPGGSLGFRLDWPGHSLAYVTDTTAGPNVPYQSQLHNLNLLIHECNFTDDLTEWAVKTGHSCTSAVANLAAACQPQRLVLTHVNPLGNDADPVDLPTARSIFPQTELARDGQIWDF